jgi:hypothetical protein
MNTPELLYTCEESPLKEMIDLIQELEKHKYVIEYNLNAKKGKIEWKSK